MEHQRGRASCPSALFPRCDGVLNLVKQRILNVRKCEALPTGVGAEGQVWAPKDDKRPNDGPEVRFHPPPTQATRRLLPSLRFAASFRLGIKHYKSFTLHCVRVSVQAGVSLPPHAAVGLPERRQVGVGASSTIPADVAWATLLSHPKVGSAV